MDYDKVKPDVNSNRGSNKGQQRHQEHNYTNPPKEETPSGGKSGTTVMCRGDTESDQVKSSATSGEGLRTRNSGAKMSSPSKSDGITRQSSSVTSDGHLMETKNRVIKKDVFNRIRRSEEELQKAAEMVRGGMTFQTASDTFNIPISTIRFYMARRGILPQRRRGRGSSGIRDDDLIHPPFEIIHYRLPDIDKPV